MNWRVMFPFAILGTALLVRSFCFGQTHFFPSDSRLASGECSHSVHLTAGGTWAGPWTNIGEGWEGGSRPGDVENVPGKLRHWAEQLEDARNSWIKAGREMLSGAHGHSGANVSEAHTARTVARVRNGAGWWLQARSHLEILIGSGSRLLSRTEGVVRGGSGVGRLGSAGEDVDLLRGLKSEQFDFGDPLTLAFARLVEENIHRWGPIKGITSGMGKTGVITNEMTSAMTKIDKLYTCLAHVKIVGGKVHYRYGGFLDNNRKLERVNQEIKMIVAALETHGMTGIETELFLNACDEPMSFDNALSPLRSGYPVLSTHLSDGTTDISVPDPMDFAYTKGGWKGPAERQRWDKMKSQAVYRSPASNFDVQKRNHGSSAQFRLHKMSDVRPDLLDARITKWGFKQSKDKDALHELKAEGFQLGAPLTPEEVNRYKYYIVADDLVGTTGMCEALPRGQTILRQSSPFREFFDAMLLPGVHYVQTDHSFRYTFPIIEWMKEHDLAMQSMVVMANKIAPLVCSWKARTLYWAILLSKYTNVALVEGYKVTPPKTICDGEPVEHAEKNDGKCHVERTKCGNFCIKGKAEDEWTWLDAKNLREVQPLMGPE